MKKFENRGFTLIEMLTVVVIIAILVGLIMSAVYQTRKAALKKKRKVDLAVLSLGIQTYYHDHQALPDPLWGDPTSPAPAARPDVTWSNENYRVIDLLTNGTIRYLDVSHFKRAVNGSLIDPISSVGKEAYYMICLDTDYDGVVSGEVMNAYEDTGSPLFSVGSEGS